jgi:hypothetical protein
MRAAPTVARSQWGPHTTLPSTVRTVTSKKTQKGSKKMEQISRIQWPFYKIYQKIKWEWTPILSKRRKRKLGKDMDDLRQRLLNLGQDE